MRRPTPTMSKDNIDRISVKVAHRVSRDEIRSCFVALDALYGTARDYPDAKLSVAMNLLRNHLEAYGETGHGDHGDDFDEEWAERMTAAIWGE